MSKVKLVLRPNEFTSFTSYYLETFWRQFFDIEIFDQQACYDKKRTLFAVWWMNITNGDQWPQQMKDRGYKIVVDNLWEQRTFRTDFYWIEHKYSMRWNESLWWRALGYHSYCPKKQINLVALMQLRRQNNLRDFIVNYLDDVLPQMLWSYMARDLRLSDDTDDQDQGQRYMHPNWYDHTYCSMVVETGQFLPLHVSEKSYKPLAYYHPFMVVAASGTLSFLRAAGFETFDNVFDESYDLQDDLVSKLQIIKSNLLRITDTKTYDAITLEKIQHNHDLFFDENLVKDAMIKEIIMPLMQYAET